MTRSTKLVVQNQLARTGSWLGRNPDLDLGEAWEPPPYFTLTLHLCCDSDKIAVCCQLGMLREIDSSHCEKTP